MPEPLGKLINPAEFAHRVVKIDFEKNIEGIYKIANSTSGGLPLYVI